MYAVLWRFAHEDDEKANEETDGREKVKV